LEVRKCLINRDWGNLSGKLSAALSAQVDGPETNLAKDETAGRCTAADCLEGLRVAVAEVVNPSDDFGHPSEGTLDSRLSQAERLEMKDLPEIIAGREMLDRIRKTRQQLQIGLTVTQYEDTINLAEQYLNLYGLFENSTKEIRSALEMAQAFSYVTKETRDAEALLQEITILWYLQEDMQSGGYYEGGNPSAPPQDTVALSPIASHYNDYSGFPFVTKIGLYIVKKLYYIVMLRSAIYDICNNPDNINSTVAAAVEIGCPTTPEYVSAQGFMNQLNDTRHAMNEAESVVREDLLINAINMCDALFYNNADVERVRALKNLVIELNEESRKALWVMDKARMQSVYDRATAIRLTTLHFEYLKILLDLGAMDWLKYEIKKAKELGDENRKIRLAIMMKDLTLDQFGHMFGLNSLKNMRSPENYASQKLLTMDRKKLAAGMLSFSKTPAHTSLIDFAQLVHEHDPQSHKLVQQLIKDSTRTFKNIMGYMGDKKYPDTTSLVQEIVQMCLDQPMLRSEVYLQTIKQITNHPIPANAKKGYELLAVWCWQFPPQPDLDNILETYLRSVPEKSVAYLGRLRDVMYAGCGRAAPSGGEIESFVRDFFSSAAKRSRYEENVAVIKDVPYTDEFFQFESVKKLFQLDEEDAKYKI
jgi:CheY-like chemotaxis protein